MRIGTFETAMTAGQRALRAAAAALPLAFAAPGSAAAQDSEEVLYSIPDELFKTPIQESEARVLDWLRSNPDLPDSVLDGDNNTFMHYAATNLSSILREAVRRGGDCNRKNAHGATPLHFAAVQDGLGPGPEALRILVRCEASPNVKPMCAAGERTAEDCRADPNARDRLGRTPLHSLIVSAEAGAPFPIRNFNSILSGARFDVARVLLEELGADPNVKDNDGDTPLMLMVRAVNSGAFSQDKASLLLRHGADPNTRNNKGATPLIEIVSLFSEVNEDEDSIRLIRLLLRRGADPDLRARNSDTPLIRAAKHEDDSLYEIRALLAGGADPCLRDRRGRIAHQYAEEVGAEASMEALERAGGYLSFVNSVHGFCVRDMRMAEEREKKLALDRAARRELQSCLQTLGFDPGADTELFGPATRAAIRDWQVAQGREGNLAMGFLSRDDADALRDACATAALQPLCDGQSDAGCWMATAQPAGCYIWNRHPQPDETVTWSGDCVDGKVSGRGTAEWRPPGAAGQQETWQYEVAYIEGRMADGPIMSRSSAGDSFEGSLLHGHMQGHWMMRYSDGEAWEGPLVSGKREGLWVRTKPGPRMECHINGSPQGVVQPPDAESWVNCDFTPIGPAGMQVAERTSLHAGPGSDYSVIGHLDADTKVTAIAESLPWVGVEVVDAQPGMVGFVPKDRLREIETAWRAGRQLRVLEGHEDYVLSVAFSPDGRTIVSGVARGSGVHLWDAASGRQLWALKAHEGNWYKLSGLSVAFSPDGRTVAGASGYNRLHLWDAASGRELRLFHDRSGGPNLNIAFSPDGRTIAGGSGYNSLSETVLRLQDAASGRQLWALEAQVVGGVTSVAFSPDGRTIASGAYDFRLDDYYGTVRLWDAASGRQLLVLEGHEDYVLSVAFSPDGRTIASGSGDKTMRLWDAASGRQLLVLEGHEGWVSSVAFSPDGRTIASGSRDGTVRLWEGG